MNNLQNTVTNSVRSRLQHKSLILRIFMLVRGISTLYCLANLLFVTFVQGFQSFSLQSITSDLELLLPSNCHDRRKRSPALVYYPGRAFKNRRFPHEYRFRSWFPTQTLYSAALDDEAANKEEKTKPLFSPSNDTYTQIAIVDIALSEHKPLGCTVEESLAPYNLALKAIKTGSEEEEGKSSLIQRDASFPVFVQKLVEGGNADQFGLKVGDVIVGVTGVFDELQDVSYEGLDKVKSLVSGVEAGRELVIRVMRGTDVKERHEEALVDLCTLDGNDADMNACLDSIFTYGDDIDAGNKDIDDIGYSDDVVLESMYQLWGDELGPEQEDQVDTNADKEEASDAPPKKAPAPWSSRSSPSGTFVRNPRTGKLEDISKM